MKAALAGVADEDLPRTREELLAVPGVGERTVDQVLASLRGQPSPGPPSAHPRAELASSLAPLSGGGSNGHGYYGDLPDAALYPAASVLFPLLYERGNDYDFAQKQAMRVSRELGGGEALLAERAFEMLRAFYASGRIPTGEDARECVRLARAVYAEIGTATPSPFDAEPEGEIPLEV